MVKIETYINKSLVEENIVSNSFIEFYFVKNAINYIIKNFVKKNSAIDLYREYVKSIAIQKNSLNSKGVIHNLEVWINKTYSNDIKKQVCIVCNNEKVWFSI